MEDDYALIAVTVYILSLIINIYSGYKLTHRKVIEMKNTFYFDGIKPRIMQYISGKESSDGKEHTLVSRFIYRNIVLLICCILPLVLLFMIIYVIALCISNCSEWLVRRLDSIAELFPRLEYKRVIEVDGKPITKKGKQ
jgi:hypothetical protein